MSTPSAPPQSELARDIRAFARDTQDFAFEEMQALMDETRESGNVSDSRTAALVSAWATIHQDAAKLLALLEDDHAL